MCNPRGNLDTKVLYQSSEFCNLGLSDCFKLQNGTDYLFSPSNPMEVSNCQNNYIFFIRWKPNNIFQILLLLVLVVFQREWEQGWKCCPLKDFDLSSFLFCGLNNMFLFT